jgi:acylphosphatase
MNACMEARRYGVSGWIRNRFDGTVELEAEGLHESVEEMIRWCRRGPAMAVVSEVHVAEIAPRNDSKSFRIVD